MLTGSRPITIGPNVVLHPHSKISSAHAPVVLGDGVVVYERGRVGVSAVVAPPVPSGVRDGGRGEGVLLGRNVVVETGAVVEAAEVGEGTVIEAGVKLGVGCVIGKVSEL
jgi:dynactin-6